MSNNIGTPEVKSRLAPRMLPPDTQQECIDLPGEEVRCVVHKPKLEIMLRKHRDVVFDIRLFKGMQYTVEADEGDFYNARDKKIVLRARRQKVSFANGERMHLWLSRKFKGSLILKANGKVLGRYKPDQLDPGFYDEDPRIKAAPIIIAMNNEPPAAGVCTPQDPMGTGRPAAPKVAELSFEEEFVLLTNPPKPKVKPEDQSMHVVEVRPESGRMPDEVADFFKKGGEDTAIDAAKLLTRNWLWAQIAGASAYVGDNLPWIRELWAQKFYLSKVKGKVYIIFKGSPGLRQYLTGTRYLSDTTKVIAISAGAGTISGVHKAGWEAVKGSMKGAAKFALIFTIVLDVAEWMDDYEQRDPVTGKPKRDFYDLGAKILTDVAWAVVGAVIGTIAMAILVGAAASGVGLVIVIGAIAISAVAGYALAWIDTQLGVTPAIASAARDAARYLDNKLPRDYADYEQSINNMMLGGAP